MTMKTTDIEKASAFYLDEIRQLLPQPVRFMEVCGTHTVSIFRAGIRQLLPESVDLVSGPGCPVCVTEDLYMDQAIETVADEMVDQIGESYTQTLYEQMKRNIGQ